MVVKGLKTCFTAVFHHVLRWLYLYVLLSSAAVKCSTMLVGYDYAVQLVQRSLCRVCVVHMYAAMLMCTYLLALGLTLPLGTGSLLTACKHSHGLTYPLLVVSSKAVNAIS